MSVTNLVILGGTSHNVCVTYELIHHGLVSVPSRSVSRPGIYWLRLFRGDPSSVAIVTEVPLNPGYHVDATTRQEIEDYIFEHFNVHWRDLTCYRIMPRGYPDRIAPKIFTKKGWIDRVVLERLIGRELPDLPDNQELRRRVLELGADSGMESESIRRQVFEAVRVTDLPPPHNPFRCMHRNRFEAMRHDASFSGSGGEQEVGQEFIASLAPDEVKACWFHQADWAAIANESVRIVEKVGRLKPESDYLKEVWRSNISGQDHDWDSDFRWLLSLFEQPIIIAGGGYTDGQHRACALRFSGTPRAAVVTGYEDIEVVTYKNDWQYEGDG